MLDSVRKFVNRGWDLSDTDDSELEQSFIADMPSSSQQDSEEGLLSIFKQLLPEEVRSLLGTKLAQLESGDFESILGSEEARGLFFSSRQNDDSDFGSWENAIDSRVEALLSAEDETVPKEAREYLLFLIGYAALLAFLQSNITGPPLPFSPAKIVLGDAIAEDKVRLAETRKALISGLSVDGIAAFRLTPNVELLVLALRILSNARILLAVNVARWGLLRARVMHQRLLSEVSGSLEAKILQDLEAVEEELFSGDVVRPERIQFLLERASIETLHGHDKKAREDLDVAARKRKFQFALTGLLGRRTKFQTFDTSQLVVLAKSAEDAEDNQSASTKGKQAASNTVEASGPQNLDLNDDTLLESISFTEKPTTKSTTDVQNMDSLPKELAELDPSAQPQLKPLDSIILLALASSITNTSPADGLTREETLPYATRVLEGGSSNWQIYTQALLVRSRLEGYKSRTVERGLLQLQALVDQVIADTSETTTSETGTTHATATSFLPKTKDADSAPAAQRLRYIFQLASPSRWELEAELAQRWVSLGGLRSALEIYERLEMWAEAALCYAATEKEETAKRMVRRQLYHTTSGIPDLEADDDETWEGEERVPPPADAARLYCIIGDVDNDPIMYEKAWSVSGERYARAQRSLGRHWLAKGDHLKAADAYAKSLKANQLNHGSWFALGCALLELTTFDRAAECFRRCVQLDDTDAEAWSNLAAALLKNEAVASTTDASSSPPVEPTPPVLLDDEEEEEEEADAPTTPVRRTNQQNRKDALMALKRAAALKHDSHRIWENLLIVSSSVSPPDIPTIITSQKNLILLRGPTIGESAIDVEICGRLVTHVVASSDTYDPSKPGYERFLVELFDKNIVPLITSSRPLWQQVAKLALWRNKPGQALEAHEKAWRAVTVQPGWETESESRWNDVVDATVDLCDAYENFGPRERTEGMGAGAGGLVAKDWRFKGRSAVRGVMGRGRDCWEGTEGWERLKGALEGLKG